MIESLHHPLFTVAVTTYNRQADLQRALKSLEQQTYRNFEVIVVDDGSSDGTKEMMEHYQGPLNLTYQWRPNWGGPARGRNLAIQLARGTWIAFLDGDDWWYPDKLKRLLPHLDGQDVIYHELDYQNANGLMGRTTNGRMLENPIFYDLLINGNCLSNSGTCVRRAMLEQVGGLSEDRMLIAVEDYELWLRLSQVTERFYFIADSLGVYWIGGNISTPSAGFIAKIHYVTEKYLSFLPGTLRDMARQRETYIIARNKMVMGDQTAYDDFKHLALFAKKLNLRLRAFYFILSRLWTKKDVLGN